MTSLSVHVDGVPVPQGSMVRNRFGGMRHSKPELIAMYRAEVKRAVLAAVENEAILLPLDGPLNLTATFVLPRPKSAPKKRVWPTVKPDADKLLRALCDALTQCGAWVDDAVVVRMTAEKRYVGQVAGWDLPCTHLMITPCNDVTPTTATAAALSAGDAS